MKSTPETVGMSSARLSRINQIMSAQIDAGALDGISTLVARRGKIVHFEQFGSSVPDTIFRLYSMTKPIVCTALMCLYEHGLFDLKDPVSKFIPAFAQLKVLETDAAGVETLVDPVEPVTIHHLLTHTSGLVYDFYESSPVCQMYREGKVFSEASVSLETLVNKLCEYPLAFQPGTKWFYSLGIDVIGRLIEVIAGKPLNEYLEEVIFKPLEMKDTGFFVPEEKRNRVAAMYGGADLGAENISWTELMDVWRRGINEKLDVSKTDPIDDKDYCRGGAGLKSTAQDYFKFAQMLLNKGELNGVRILGPRTVDFMHMNHVDPTLLPIGFEDFKLTGYGFGLGSRVLLNVAESKALGSQFEYGWAGAAKTYYCVDPKEDLVWIFLTQSMCNFSMIERAFQTAIYQSILE